MLKRFLSLVAGLFFSVPALAVSQSPQVMQIPNIATLQSGNYLNFPQIGVSGYYAANDGGAGTLTLGPKPASATATGNAQNNSQTITGITVPAGWGAGMAISDGLGALSVHTFILAVTSNTVTISIPASSSQTGDTFTVICANGGTIFADGAGNCFYRTNTGPTMDMRQWGITAGSIYDATANLTNMTDSSWIIQGASEIGSAQGVVNFSYAGVSVFWASNYIPPAATSITCGAPSVTQISNGYYVGLPGTIYTAHGATYKTVNNQDGVALHWCLRIPEWYANPARVSQFSGVSFNSPPTTYDDGEAMRANMALAQDICLDLHQTKGAQIDHVGCMGFDVGQSFKQSDHMNISYFWADANVGMYGENGGGQSDSSTIDIEPFINKQPNTQGATCTPTSNPSDNSAGICNEIYYTITSVAAAGTNNAFGNPECSVTVGLATKNGHSTTGWPGTLLKSSQTFSNGDALTYPVWTANFDTTIGAGKANALGCKTSYKPIVLTSSGATSATFTIKGSSYATGATKMAMVASWAPGVSAPNTITTQCATGCGLLRIVSGDIQNIQPGMIVADDGSHGIPSGSVVVASYRGCKGLDIFDGYIACVFISNPTTNVSNVVDANITFDGGSFTAEGTCDGARGLTCAFFNTAERPFVGDSPIGQLVQNLPLSLGHHASAAYFSNGVAGWRQYSPFAYTHTYQWVFKDSNNWVTTDAHNDGNGELDCQFCVANYTLGSSSYGTAKGNGYTKDSDTVVVDQYNLNQSLSNNTTISGSATVAVGSTITTSGSMASWRTDGGNGVVTGKFTAAICQNIGSNVDCSSLPDNQYLTVELTGTNTVKVLACGQFSTFCQGYTNGANFFFVQVSSANDSVSFSNMVADTTDVGQTVVEIFHGSAALTDFQDKGLNRFAYVSGNQTPTAWNGFDAPTSDVLYDGAAAIASLSGCGNIFSGYTSPPTLSQLTSQQWQCSVSGQVTGVFTPTAGTIPTTLQAFGDRVFSIRDVGGVPDCTTNNTSAFNTAQTNAAAQGIHIIQLDATALGGCYNLHNVTVRSGMAIYCPGPMAVQPANNDYRNFPGISMATGGGITLSNNSALIGCNVINTNIQVAPPTGYQSNYARQAAYSGTAISISGSSAQVIQSMIVGFNTCFNISGIRGAQLRDLKLDCQTKFTLFKQSAGDSINISNVVGTAFGTQVGTGGPPETVTIPVTSVTDNGSGELQAHFASCTTENCPLNGDKLWIINATPTQSAEGGWNPHNVTATTADLQGSDSSFLTGHTETGVTVTKGLTYITGLSNTSIGQVEPTQLVSDGAVCIPAGTQIAQAMTINGYNEIWLQNSSGVPVVATCSATENITITDQAVGTTSIASATNVAPGTGYLVGDALQPTGGTVVTGNDATLTITAIDPNTGAITVMVSNVGQYTVCPGAASGVTDLTTPAATGATFNFSCGTAISLFANERVAAFNISNVNEVKVDQALFEGDAQCITLGSRANDVHFHHTICHEENALQDDTHWCLTFNSSAMQNTFTDGGCYYFSGVLDQTTVSSQISENIVSNSIVGGPPVSGLQRTVLAVVSTSPGTAKKSAITFSGNYATTRNALLFISNDARAVHMSDNEYLFGSVLGQTDFATQVISGAGNVFSTGRLPINATTVNSTNERLAPASTADLWLTNEDCGALITASSVGGTLPAHLPPLAPIGCRFIFRPNTNAITIDPNGVGIRTILGNVTSPITLPAFLAGNGELAYLWDGTAWQLDGSTADLSATSQTSSPQRLANGQVYLSCASCSGGSATVKVCPINGPGGIIINSVLTHIAPTCLLIPNSAFSAATSALRYIYAGTQTGVVSAIANDGAGHAELTLSNTTGFGQSGDAISCINMTGTTAANVADDANTTLVDSTHIILTDVSFSATGTGACLWVSYISTATSHVTDASNGIEVESGFPQNTLIGMVFVDGSHNLNDTSTKRDVASWFNRTEKKAIGVYSTDRSTSSTSYAEPNSEIEVEFVNWGAPATPGLNVPDVPWSISGTGVNGTASDGWDVSAGFDSTSAEETEQAGSANAGTVSLPFGVSGSKTSLSEGKHFMTLLAKSVTGGTTTFDHNVTSVEVRPMQ